MKIFAKFCYIIICLFFTAIFTHALVTGRGGSDFVVEHLLFGTASFISALSMVFISTSGFRILLAGSAFLLSAMAIWDSIGFLHSTFAESHDGPLEPSVFEVLFYLAAPLPFILAFVWSVFQKNSDGGMKPNKK